MVLQGHLASNNFGPYFSEDGQEFNPITVHISQEDKLRIYELWKFSLIIKLQGKRTLHHILKRKVHDLWKLQENFPLIDLGNDYLCGQVTKRRQYDLDPLKWTIFYIWLFPFYPKMATKFCSNRSYPSILSGVGETTSTPHGIL